MTISNTLPGNGETFDVCVVGTGPSGLALARACERDGLSVLLLERGNLKPLPVANPAASEGLPSCHDPLHLTMREAFGGSSWAWGGQCVTFTETDFERRPWVPGSGWPIGLADVEPHYPAAYAHLGCTRSGSPEEADPQLGIPGVDTGGLLRCSPTPRLAELHAADVRSSRLIHACLGQTVVGIDLDPSGERVVSLRVASGPGAVEAPRARIYVLAAGGIRTTQMLLSLQRSWPGHFGGPGGVLGRYYMGHVAGEVATVTFTDPVSAHPFLFRAVDGLQQQRLLRLDPVAQREHGALNTAFMLRHPPFADARHRSGLLSLIHLAYPGTAGFTPFRSSGLRDVVRNRSAMRDARLGGTRAHLSNVVGDVPGTLRNLRSIAIRKIDRRSRVPLLAPNRGGTYTLRYHAEQAPDPESRITLRREVDAHGVPELDIGFRYADRDIESIIAAHDVLNRGLRASGTGRLEYWTEPAGLAAAIRALAVDGYHQIGTARMGSAPANSTVDGEGRVHGLRNLFVASSCVFPTSGYANPTLTIVALALRTAQGVRRAVQVARAA